MLVKDIMDQKYPSIYADELATKARAVLRERALRILPVVDEHKRLVGVISRNDIMNITSSVSPIKVNGIMTTHPHKVNPDMDAVQAMREMVRRDEWYAPVIKSSQDLSYIGMLSLEPFYSQIVGKKRRQTVNASIKHYVNQTLDLLSKR